LTPEQSFDRLLAAEPSRPFVTYYDEATGERSELSAKSLANWVAKTHHLLGDELGLGVGDTALVALPAHWISVPILLGCLTAGLALTDDAGADAALANGAHEAIRVVSLGPVVAIVDRALHRSARGLDGLARAAEVDVRPVPGAVAGPIG